VRVREAFRLVLVAFIATVPGMAQSTNAIVSGLVLDPSGRPIVGSRHGDGQRCDRHPLSRRHQRRGIYEIPNLPPGPYRLQVAKPGFKTLLQAGHRFAHPGRAGCQLHSARRGGLETVTVEGGASFFDTESAAVSTVIDRQFVENLPLNGRSFNTLLQLTPGVVIPQQPPGPIRSAAPPGSSASVGSALTPTASPWTASPPISASPPGGLLGGIRDRDRPGL
jgi:hypothetical protein